MCGMSTCAGRRQGDVRSAFLSECPKPPGAASDILASDPGERELPTSGAGVEMPDWFNEVMTEHAYKTQADIQRLERKVEEQALALLDQQCKMQEVVSRLAVLAELSVTGDHRRTRGNQVVSAEGRAAIREQPAESSVTGYHRRTGGNQVVFAEGSVAVREQPAPSAYMGSLHNPAQKTDDDFLRNWLSTFRPVEEKQFKHELCHLRTEIEHSLQLAMTHFKQELQGTIANCVEMSATAEAAVRSCQKDGQVDVLRVRFEALRQNISCLQAVHDESARSSLLRKWVEKETRQKRSLAELGQSLDDGSRGRSVSQRPAGPEHFWALSKLMGPQPA